MLVGKEGSQDSSWDREQRGHTGGTVPPQVPLAASCPNPMENHLEPLVIVRETKPLPETPQGGSGELPWNSLPWLCPVSWTSSSPWKAGPGPRRGPGVSPAPCPWFWGHSVTLAVLRSDSHPQDARCVCAGHRAAGMGLLAFLVEFCWSLECN